MQFAMNTNTKNQTQNNQTQKPKNNNEIDSNIKDVYYVPLKDLEKIERSVTPPLYKYTSIQPSTSRLHPCLSDQYEPALSTEMYNLKIQQEIEKQNSSEPSATFNRIVQKYSLIPRFTHTSTRTACTFKFVQGSIVNTPDDRLIVHSIASDFKLGAGLARTIDRRFRVKQQLVFNTVGTCQITYTGRIIANLITKKYSSLANSSLVDIARSFYDLKKQYLQSHLDLILAFPLIECGLNGHDWWGEIFPLIRTVFNGCNVEIYTLDKFEIPSNLDLQGPPLHKVTLNIGGVEFEGRGDTRRDAQNECMSQYLIHHNLKETYAYVTEDVVEHPLDYVGVRQAEVAAEQPTYLGEPNYDDAFVEFNKQMQEKRVEPNFSFLQVGEQKWSGRLAVQNLIVVDNKQYNSKKECKRNLISKYLFRYSSRNIKERTSFYPESEGTEDAQGASTLLNIDNSEKVLLINQKQESVAIEFMKPISLPSSMTTFGDEASEFSVLCDRYNSIGSLPWTTSQEEGSILRVVTLPFDIVNTLRTNPSYLPFLNHAFVRPQITIKLVSNSTSFHQGLLVAGIKYFSQTSNAANGIPEPRYARQLLLLDHVLINANSSNVAEISIPYQGFTDQLAIAADGSSKLYYCTLYIGVLLPLRTADGNSPTVNIDLFAKLSCNGVQTQFYGLRTQVIPEGYVSDILSSFSNAISGLNVNNIRKRVTCVDPIAMMPWPNPQLSSGKGAQQSRVLRLDTSKSTPHHESQVPMEQQFNSNYIKKLWGPIDKCVISMDSVRGEVLLQRQITPILIDSFQKVTAQVSPIGYLGSFYSAYSGDLELKILAAKTDKQTFRLRFVTSPDVQITSDNYNDFPSVIMDFQTSDEFVERLPYYATTKVASLWSSTEQRNPTAISYGWWALVVENPMIRMDAVASTVEMMIYLRGSDNFYMYIPRPSAFLPLVNNVTNSITINYSSDLNENVIVTTQTGVQTLVVTPGQAASVRVAGLIGVSSNALAAGSQPITIQNDNNINTPLQVTRYYTDNGAVVNQQYDIAVGGSQLVPIDNTTRLDIIRLSDSTNNVNFTFDNQTGSDISITIDDANGPEVLQIGAQLVNRQSIGFRRIYVVQPDNSVPLRTLNNNHEEGDILTYWTVTGESYNGIARIGTFLILPMRVSNCVIVINNDTRTFIPEGPGDEKCESESVDDPLNNGARSTGMLQLGETFDLKSVCSRYVQSASFSVTAPVGTAQRLMFDVNTNSVARRTTATPLSLMNGLRDCFRFYRGSLDYQLEFVTSKPCRARVYHQPYASTTILQPSWNSIQGTQFMGYNVANEVASTWVTPVMPVVVPYYSKCNFLVSGYDATLSSLNGLNAHSNGVLAVECYPYDTTSTTDITVNIWQAMDGDGSYYLFQGVPEVNLNQDVVQYNTVPEAPGADIFDLMDNKNIPRRLRVVIKKCKVKAEKKLRELQRSQKLQDFQPEGPVDATASFISKVISKTAKTTFGSACLGAGAFAVTGNPIMGIAAYNAASINGAISDFAAASANAKIASHNAATLTGSVSNAVESFLNGTGSLLKTSLISSVCHMYSFIKGTVDVKIVSLIGFFSNLGLLTLDKFVEYYDTLSSLFGKCVNTVKEMFTPESPSNSFEAIAETNEGAIKWAKILLSGVVGLAAFQSKKDYVSAFIAAFKDTITFGNSITKFLSENLKWIKDFIYWVTGKEHPEIAAIKRANLVRDDVLRWAYSVLLVTGSEEEDKVHKSKERQLQVEQLYVQGQEIVTTLKDVDAELRQTLSRLFTSLKKLRDTFALTVAQGIPIEPVSFIVYGKPGTGKSNFVDDLLIEYGKAIGMVCDDNPIYTVPAGNKYWNGFTGQPLVKFGDFGTINEPTRMSEEVSWWHQICSREMFNPPIAELEMKKYICNPRGVARCTNRKMETSNVIRDPVAFNRRGDVRVEVVLSDRIKAYGTESQPIINLDDIRIPSNIWSEQWTKDFGHLNFLMYDSEWKQVGDKLDYKQFIDHVMPYASSKYRQRYNVALSQQLKLHSLSSNTWLSAGVENLEETLKQEVESNIAKQSASLMDLIKGQISLSSTPESSLSCPCLHDEYPVKEWKHETFCHLSVIKDPTDYRYCSKHECFVNINATEKISFSESCGKNCYIGDSELCAIFFSSFYEEVIDSVKGTVVEDTEMSILTANMKVPSWMAPKNPGVTQTWIWKSLTGTFDTLKGLAKSLWDFITTPWRVVLVVLGVIQLWLVWNDMSTREPTTTIVGSVATGVWDKMRLRSGMSDVWQGAFPEVIASGDVKTAKASNRAAKIITTLMTPQSAEESMKAIRRNTCWLRLSNAEKTKTLRCFGIADRYILAPYHYMVEMNNVQQAFIVMNGQSDFGGALELQPDMTVTRIEQSDLCIVYFKSKRLPAFRNILGLLPNAQELNYSGQEASLIEFELNGNPIIRAFGRVPRVTSQHRYDDLQVDNILRGYSYPYHKQGLCGSLLYDEHINRIIGVHVCASSGTGFAQAVCREMFNDLDLRIKEVHEPDMKPSQNAKVNPMGNYIPIGQLERGETPNMPTKTAIAESPSYGVLRDPPHRKPVVLAHPEDVVPGYHNLESGAAKMTDPTRPWPIKDLERVEDDIGHMLLALAKPKTTPHSCRGFQEAIFGVPGVDFMQSLYLNTSPGWPLNTKYTSCKKEFFLEFDEVNGQRQLKGLHPALSALYSEQHSQRLQREVPFTPYLTFLKDERLKAGKDPRTINGCSFAEIIEWRRYTMDFFAAFQSASFQAGTAIGINVRSPDWTKLANFLTENSTRILTADYKNFGPRLDTDFIRRIGRLCNDWYATNCPERNQDDDVIREILFEGLASATHVVGDLTFRQVCGSPSGNPWTAPINCLCNLFYIELAWLELTKDYPSLNNLQSFRKYVRIVCYGDDLIMSICEELHDLFNNITLQQVFEKHDIIFTDAAKDGTMRKSCDLLEASFLKHSFIPHPVRGSFYLAGLEKPVIEDIPSWIRTPCQDPDAQAMENADQCARLAYGWGPAYYQEIVGKLRAFWSKKGKNCTFLNWEEIDSQCFDIDKKSLQQNEDALFLYRLQEGLL